VDPVPDPLLFSLVVPGIEPGPPDLIIIISIIFKVNNFPFQKGRRIYFSS
jgi:hypothetical protein